MKDDRLPELFARAAALDLAARRALLAEVTADEPALAADLAELLASAASEEWEIDRSPWLDVAAPATLDAVTRPMRVGPFRLLSELGRGGMGQVYLAEEETADYCRKVALKLIGRPTDAEAIRRFRDEVRILASLDHPAVARFLAGGRSPEGVWFLALEYVEGEDLLRHSERAPLALRDRIALFREVLDAVRFAHERGVVHRDIKPGHILVGPDGRPRLLDFGISKLVRGDGTGLATATATGTRALTPAYASPEQFRGEPATPSSDIYSLGVVLYELLAGRRPFEDLARSPLELERAVLERDPEPPSTAARRERTEGATTEPTAPGTRPPATYRPVPDRDLDAICLKALRKAPSERYADVAAFDDDLERYLEGRPVTARRGGFRYRAGRFVRRERARLLAAAAIVVTAVAVGLAFAASREAARLRPPEPPAAKPFPFADLSARSIEEREQAFAAAPESLEEGAALALALVSHDRFEEAALVLGRMRQIPGKETDPLSDYVEGAIAQHSNQPQRALVLFTRARDGALARGRGELVGRTRAMIGRVLAVLGRHDEGEREMELALAEYEKAGDRLSSAQVLNNLAIEALQRGDYVRGEERLELSLARFRAVGASGAVVLRNLAEVCLRRGRPDAAEHWARESIRVVNVDRPRQARRLWVLAEALAEQGRVQEALPILDEALGYLRTNDDWPDLAYALLVRGRIDVAAARFDRLDAFAAELEGAASASGSRVALLAAKLLRGWSAAALGDHARAETDLAEAHRLQVEENEPVLAALTNVDRALVALASGDPEAARGVLDDDATDAGVGSSAGVLAESVRARIDAETGRLDEARRRLAALGEDDANAPDLRRRLTFLRARAELARAAGRIDDARNDLDAAAAAARAGDRRVDEIELRLRATDLAGGEGGAERARWTAKARELGLLGLARRGEGERAPLPAP